MDTKTDLVLSPTEYFNAHLRKRIKTIQRKKGFDVKALRVEDIDIKMIVEQRAVPDIVRQFDTIDAAMQAVKKQIARWWDLYPNKRQSYHVTLNYVQTNQSVMDPKGRQRPKQGTSATRGMHVERAAHLQAEKAASGHPADWPEMYDLFYCRSGCDNNGHYCLSDGKTHFLLETQHMQSIVEYKQNGGKIESHADVPYYIRKQLVSVQSKRRKKKLRARFDASAGTPGLAEQHRTSVPDDPNLAGTSRFTLGPSKPSSVIALPLRLGRL